MGSSAKLLDCIALLGLFVAPACAQGVGSANLPPAPKPAPSGLPFPVSFTDVAREAGITHPVIHGRPDRKKYILETNGAGLAFIDYDEDGWLDLLVVNGSRFTPFSKGQEPISRLYRNEGAGKFVDVSRKAGVARSGWGSGVCSGDFDNDGHEDLYVTYWGSNSLYRNTGKGTFEDVAKSAGVLAGGWSTGCSFADIDRDGNLDLLVVRYLDFDLKKIPLPGQFAFCMFKDAPVLCGPRGLPHSKPTLYRNRGDGTFEDISEASGIRDTSPCYAFTVNAADLNGDGWVDFYIACDLTPSLYFRNNRDGTFTEIGTEAGVAYNEHGAEQAGMGVAIGDFNRDGWLDITKTNFIRDYPNLYQNRGKGIFEDVVVSAGLAVNPQYILWGTGFVDLDNDGWTDIFQVAGHVYAEIESIDPAEPYRNPRLIYRNLGNGKFEDVSALAGRGVADRHSSRGAAFGDYDNDGDLDVAIMNMDEPPSLLRNDYAGAGRWIKVKPQGVKSNRSAIGATVTVQAGGVKQTAPVVSQSSFLSVNDSRLHFGLGPAEKVESITVRWPSGETEEFPGAPAGSLVLLVERSGKTAPLPLKK